MQTTHYTQKQAKIFNGETVKNVTGRILIGKDDGAPNFCMRLFEIEKDGHTPRHSHAWEHEIFVHKGIGEVFLADHWERIESGHAVFIPGNIDHQLRNTGDAPFIFVCLIPKGAPEL